LPENLAGKTLICLVNDPGFATNDTTLFNGRAVTYSGRWTYKYEEAGRRGADAIFIVHNTEAAGYPWSVVKTGRLEPSLKVDSTAKGEDKCQIEGWLTEDSARSLFSAAGLSFDEVKAKASKRGFKPISLSNTKVNDLRLATSLNRIKSDNVIAVLDGADTKEVVVFTAHWDHFGVSQDGKCYHGARDNALGCAALISLTKAFASIPKEKVR
jgi:Zn-dependent M28 family amino/carboxypeptidase